MVTNYQPQWQPPRQQTGSAALPVVVGILGVLLLFLTGIVAFVVAIDSPTTTPSVSSTSVASPDPSDTSLEDEESATRAGSKAALNRDAYQADYSDQTDVQGAYDTAYRTGLETLGTADAQAGKRRTYEKSWTKELRSSYDTGYGPDQATTPKPKSSTPKATRVSDRQWAKVVKSPDKYSGKRYIIYGEVTQFDSATGEARFLAYTAHRNTTSYGWFDGENTMLEGDADKLEDLVEDDVFKATVTVTGSYDYDTQIGGNTSVPLLHVDKITVIGRN